MIQDFFAYDQANGLLVYKIGQEKLSIKQKGITSAIYYPSEERIICLYTLEETERLVGFDLLGVILFDVSPPKHYSFWYLSVQKLQIACQANSDQVEPSGRSGWWFSIDPNDGSLLKAGWVY